MHDYTRDSLRQALKNQVRRLQHKTSLLDRLSGRLSMIRLGSFIGGLALVYLAGRLGPEWLFWLAIALFVAGFWRLIKIHNRIDQAIQKFRTWQSIRTSHLARQDLHWEELPYRTPSDDYAEHPYASDLDIIGKHSLLQLMDTTTYQGSTDRLAAYLLEREPQPQEVESRQAIVKELTGMPTFRDFLHLQAELNRRQELDSDWTLEDLLHHLQDSREVKYTFPLLLLGGLSALNIILGILYLLGVIGPYVVFSWVAYLIIYNFNSEKIQGLYDESSQIEKLLSRFNAVLHFLETYDYPSKSRIKEFCRPFWSAGFSPSKYIKRIVRIAGAASSQQSEVVWVLLNFLVPWDLYFSQKLSSYKQELAPRLEEWIYHFYELEAFSSMATFAWLHPDYTFALPSPRNKQPLHASALGHPLIPRQQKVTNDVTIDNKGDILLITGSNMAGKSTFLRTIGINLALCFSGAPANAASFSARPFRLFTSINISDSLDDGLSHFYAEVKRLRTLLDLLEDNHDTPVFFMVDEIYRGTNNRERLRGSEAFLKRVAGKNGVGLVSTHDLELAQLEDTIPQLSNWHFAETIEEGKMSFEYKLKPGPCPTTNALKIMEMEGLPV
ncbi:MutS family DNA mismatch repair protein [Fodinibius sediminis]|uniref:MutS domain V n=1 Tax=Fodinibius sediminis TaxID=1214077 RepID=A0A521B885_9BACT|nr:MutS family DNA mismatch repair protein [Fodinibius sediminis]SMO43283.1 MutS domain V [Fodinibius sediminis]